MLKPEGFEKQLQCNVDFSKVENILSCLKYDRVFEVIPFQLSDKGLHVYFKNSEFKGLIPLEEIFADFPGAVNKSYLKKISTPLSVCVIDVLEDEKTIILSRKKASGIALEEILKLKPGDVVNGVVTSVHPKFVFVDIGSGNSFLLPIQNSSRSFVSNMSDRFEKGEKINCIIKSVNQDTKKVVLTHRELLGTWEQNVMNFSPGIITNGIVRKIESEAVYIELLPNLFGLADTPNFDIKENDVVTVNIDSITPVNMKIRLKITCVQKNINLDMHHYNYYHYYYKPGDHIKSWKYSPDYSNKVIETIFEEE